MGEATAANDTTKATIAKSTATSAHRKISLGINISLVHLPAEHVALVVERQHERLLLGGHHRCVHPCFDVLPHLLPQRVVARNQEQVLQRGQEERAAVELHGARTKGAKERRRVREGDLDTFTEER